jgi:predicted alpha/beta-hydrolase family hydrolase
LFDGPADAAKRIALAHGAGAGMNTPFLTAMAAGLAARGVRVARFEFPYMAARRQGRKAGPDRAPVLREAWLRVINELGADGLVIGGKSMGGRIASLIADEAGVRGLVCLGYPFHPVGKPDQLRVAHLANLATPTLIVQGTRDPFGTREEVAGYKLADTIKIHWLEDGDHDFKPRKASGHTQPQHWEQAVAVVAAFIDSL